MDKEGHEIKKFTTNLQLISFIQHKRENASFLGSEADADGESPAQKEPPSRFSFDDPAEAYRQAYERFYEETHKTEWRGTMLEENYI